MFGLSGGESDVERRAADLANDLPGATRTNNLARLRSLLTEERAPSPIQIFKAWKGKESFLTPEEVAEHSPGMEVDHFDPAEDAPSNSALIMITQTYDEARTAGLDEEADLLRSLPKHSQSEFARYLRAGVLPEVAE